MTRKKKKIMMVTVLAAGTIILAGAAFANYNTSNGYDVGKLAAKALMSNENYTADITVRFTLDGKEMHSEKITELYDRDGDVRLNRTALSSADRASQYYMGTSEDKIWMQDGAYITMYKFYDGREGASVYENSYDWQHGVGAVFDVRNSWNEEDRKTNDKFIRFGELIADTMVGDLKNNIVYVSGDDYSSAYELNLDSMQIPEFANAGLSAMFSSMRTYDSDDPMLILGDDPIVSNASLKFTVDNQGRILNANAEGTLKGRDDSGETHSASLELSLEMSDYGTTKPERVDISSLPNVERYQMDDDGRVIFDETETEYAG